MEFNVNLVGLGVRLDPPPPDDAETAAEPGLTLMLVDGLVTPNGPFATGQVTVRFDAERLQTLRDAVNDPEGYIRKTQEAHEAQQAAVQARSKLVVPGPHAQINVPRAGNGNTRGT